MTVRPENRTIVVTGGSKGIGQAICIALAAPDTTIFLSYHSDENGAAKTVEQIQAYQGQAFAKKMNIAVEPEVQDFFTDVIKQTGRIDVLINNAGIAKDGLIVRMKDADFSDVIDTNLKGAFYCTKAVGKIMLKQRRGKIINIASVVGVSGNAGQANYAASKAGIIGLTKSAARELASRGITVNAIAPGFIETDMTQSLSEALKQAAIAQIPLARIGYPKDVADVVAFMASDKADYITGQVIHVSGGMYM